LLHEAIGHGMEADFARKKTTIYTDKIGQRIAPEIVTIVDDGTQPGLRGSINIDDEGRKSQRTVLVEKGIFKTFMHDRISAAHFKVDPTGNGRRQSFRHMPIPRMRATYMLEGPHSHEEIIRSVKRGIYAVSFTNGEVNIGAGDFTFYIKNGYLIENGKLTAPLKDINIIGNGPRVLEKVSMVGDDLELDEGGWTCGKRGQGVPVSLGLPTVKVDAITVGGTQKSRPAPKGDATSGKPKAEGGLRDSADRREEVIA
jgi:TldD protein